MSRILSEQDFVVRPVLDGVSAIASTQIEVPDLILLDVKMPNMDGYEVCQELKANQQTLDIPVIFISAQTEVFDKVKAFQVGAVDYITKPIQAEELLARVRTHLKIRNLTLELQNANQELSHSLATLKTTQEQLIHSEKMAALGGMVAGVAHELRNPLNFVNSLSEMSADLVIELNSLLEPIFEVAQNRVDFEENQDHSNVRDKKNEEASHNSQPNFEQLPISLRLTKENLKSIQEISNYLIRNNKEIQRNGNRANNIIKLMFDHSRNEANLKQVTDINELLEQAIKLSYHNIKDINLELKIERHYDNSLPKLLISPQSLSRVFINLINNACYAMLEKQQKMNNFSPILSLTTKNTPEVIEVYIKDNGTGIDNKKVNKVFEPFFTTKPPGEGTGLGLSLTHDIITKEHQGSIHLKTKLGEYTEIIVSLPKNNLA